jgi:hypothetical protein
MFFTTSALSENGVRDMTHVLLLYLTGKLLMAFTSTAVFGSESLGTRDNIILSYGSFIWATDYRGRDVEDMNFLLPLEDWSGGFESH